VTVSRKIRLVLILQTKDRYLMRFSLLTSLLKAILTAAPLDALAVEKFLKTMLEMPTVVFK